MEPVMDQRPLRSGQLARMTGVSTDLLRHYERIGVLPAAARAANGYRLYPPQSAERARTVRRSVALGFSLAEVSRILAVRDRGGIPCQKVRALAAEKLRGVEQSLTELHALRRHLREILHDWDRRLAKAGKKRRAGLLESLRETQGWDNAAVRNLNKKGFRK